MVSGRSWVAGGQVLRLRPHGRAYRLWCWPGKIAKCMAAGKPYEAPLLEHIYEQRFTGLVIDAGANLGNHTMWFARVCGLRVVAFEPLWVKQLMYNVALNRMQRQVQVKGVALGDGSMTAIHAGKGRLITGAGKLPVRKLDDFKLTGVTMIKADVEGMEPALLRGGEVTIRRDKPVIFAESWNDDAHRALADVLEPWGYQMTRKFHSKGVATAVERWDYAQ